MAEEQTAENRGDGWNLTSYLQWGIYTSIPAWIHWQISVTEAETPSLMLSFQELSLTWSRRPP